MEKDSYIEDAVCTSSKILRMKCLETCANLKCNEKKDLKYGASGVQACVLYKHV
jgi:hypothetical protein